MSATDNFKSASEFVHHLHSLRQTRRSGKTKWRDLVFRESLSSREREEVFAKTGGRCHLCGDPLEGKWVADHLSAHCLGGPHSLDNYLPADALCNHYRWFYESEEFQWILKLGVWLRTQIETETTLGRLAATAFVAHEWARARRRKKNTEPRAISNAVR